MQPVAEELRPSPPLTAARSGSGRLVARAESGRTVLETVHAASPLRFLRPDLPGCRAAAVCLVTFGGGLVDGDRIDLDLDVGPGAAVLLFTQASTKAFRGASRQNVRAQVAGTLVMLPDPVAAFADARYTQRIDVALEGEGRCLLLDSFTSGRAAYGERWAMGALDLRTTITRDGATVLRDALVLDRDDGGIAERMDRFDVLATLVAVGGLEKDLRGGDAVTRDLVVSTSALGGDGAIARMAATTPEVALAEVRRRLRNIGELGGAVDPYASRY